MVEVRQALLSHSFLTKEREIGNEKVSKIIDILPEINPIWLVTGKGEMLGGMKTQENQENNIPITSTVKKNKEGIPLLPSEALASMGSEDASILQYDYEYFVIPVFKEAEFLITVRGAGMSPKYNSGDILACKKVLVSSFFQWNQVYVLYTEQGVLIKRIKKSSKENFVSIVSDNSDYETFDLAINDIRLLAIVMGVIRLE